jgi:hypothetical protein
LAPGALGGAFELPLTHRRLSLRTPAFTMEELVSRALGGAFELLIGLLVGDPVPPNPAFTLSKQNTLAHPTGVGK